MFYNLGFGIVAVSSEEQPALEEPKIVYSFNNEEEIKEFAQFAQFKFTVINKISVLENYINLEKNNLDEINGQLLLKYKIDPSKNYSLDTKEKKIFETETDSVPEIQKKEPSSKLIYNFVSDDDIKNFVAMIQIKQSVLNRITVLQDYLLSEKNNIDRINGQLILKYKIDPSKNYSLDPDKKIIVETK